MQYDTILGGSFKVEDTLEQAQYSMLCKGEQYSSGQSVLIRLWLTTHPVSQAEEQRIRSEVSALQSIQHPHLQSPMSVYASKLGVAVVYPAISAGTLDARLSQKDEVEISQAEALLIIRQIGEALQALHDRGLTHGNLTPQAVGFTIPEHVSLGEYRFQSILDIINDYQCELDETVPRCLYMAPEQFQGAFTPLGDQYALGCLAYMLLTRRVPFAGSSREPVLKKHMQDEPASLRSLNPALSAELDAAVLKTLAKDPAQRYSSIQEFLDLLQPFVQNDPASLLLSALVPGQHSSEENQTALGSGERHWDWDGRSSFSSSDHVQALALADEVTRVDLPAVPSHPLAMPPSSPLRPVRKDRRGLLVALSGLLVVALLAASVGVLVLASRPVRPPKIVLVPTPTSLLTPVTQQVTSGTNASGTVVVIQIPQPTPTLPPPHATPTSPAQPTPNGAPTPPPSSQPGQPSPATASILPLLNCVAVTGSNYLAKFGYQNKASSAVKILMGKQNFLTPLSLNGQQPTIFSPGRQDQVLQIHFNKGDTVTWTLNGYTVIASSQSPAC